MIQKTVLLKMHPSSKPYSRIHIELFSSGIFNANSIDLIENVYTSKGCQSHCKLHAQQGCKYFAWNSEDHSCELFSSLDGLEYDENGISFVGMAEGCFECEV